MVHARRSNLDEHFARARRRPRNIVNDETVIRAGIFDADGFHCCSVLALRGPRALRNINGRNDGRKIMAIDPEELLPKKKMPEIVMGQDLSTLSEHELSLRIEMLNEEIVRHNEAIKARQATKLAADSFFKR
jgi:uncharacterized small protein (DUF1192 family)